MRSRASACGASCSRARPSKPARPSASCPGDMQAKVDPYLRPLYDALEDMMPHERMQRALETRIIEIAPLAYMRGRTLADAFVILDEAQNATGAQMKMFLTRLGVNCKVVITGDKTQIDLPQREDSGLIQIERILPGIDGIAFHLPRRNRRGPPPAGARDHPRLRGGPDRLMPAPADVAVAGRVAAGSGPHGRRGSGGPSRRAPPRHGFGHLRRPRPDAEPEPALQGTRPAPPMCWRSACRSPAAGWPVTCTSASGAPGNRPGSPGAGARGGAAARGPWNPARAGLGPPRR